MKMEIEVVAPKAGTVREIRVKETDVVKEGQVLVVLD
jgi:biotin carboxyl carrier protein